ncbi:MAG: hypothetical protein IJS04_02200 [Muribaculaceae bacterium]|nr:hypothetical protein [Muribaculaceae bacterium]
MNITKAKLSKGGTLEVAYVDDDGNDVCLKGKNPVHEDFKARLNALIPYFAELTEQREAVAIDWHDPGSVENEDLLHRISVTGVSVKGFDTDQQCVLTGKRTLATSKTLNLCTPLTGFDIDTETYERCEDLRDAVQALLYEAELYIREKKWAVVQHEINFDGNPDDPFAEVTATADVPVEEPEAVPA